jgi:hypothetical protein
MTMFSSLWFSAPVITGSNTANATSTSSGAVHTFLGQSLGAADGSRIIAVGVGAGDNIQNRTITSVTVGGVSLTQRIVANNSTPTGPVENFEAEIWSGAVPSGTTADIVVTMSGIIGAYRGVGISVHRMVGSVVATPSATASDSDTTGSTDPLTVSVNTEEGGYVVCCGLAFKVAPNVATWSGVTELTDSLTGNLAQTAANYSPTSNESPRAITVNFTNPSYVKLAVSASWFPE